jgi:hypothetical protein
MGVMRNEKKVLETNFKGRGNRENLGMDRRIILKLILGKLGMSLLNRLKWLRTDILTSFCEQGQLNPGNFFTGKILHNEVRSLSMTNEKWGKEHDQVDLYHISYELFETCKNYLIAGYGNKILILSLHYKFVSRYRLLFRPTCSVP